MVSCLLHLVGTRYLFLIEVFGEQVRMILFIIKIKIMRRFNNDCRMVYVCPCKDFGFYFTCFVCWLLLNLAFSSHRGRSTLFHELLKSVRHFIIISWLFTLFRLNKTKTKKYLNRPTKRWKSYAIYYDAMLNKLK